MHLILNSDLVLRLVSSEMINSEVLSMQTKTYSDMKCNEVEAIRPVTTV